MTTSPADVQQRLQVLWADAETLCHIAHALGVGERQPGDIAPELEAMRSLAESITTKFNEIEGKPE
jgi:hypothetical protein